MKDKLRVINALEHSNIINQDGVLLDEDLNLCLDEDGTQYIIPNEARDLFRIYDENKKEFIKNGF